MKKTKQKTYIDDKNYFKGNPKLRAPDVEIEYSDEQIKELIKCMDDFVYFCVKYIKIVDSDKGRIIPFDLYPYQMEMAKLYKKEKRIIVNGPKTVW